MSRAGKNQLTRELISARKTSHKHSWHDSKYKVHKLLQRHIHKDTGKQRLAQFLASESKTQGYILTYSKLIRENV